MRAQHFTMFLCRTGQPTRADEEHGAGNGQGGGNQMRQRKRPEDPYVDAQEFDGKRTAPASTR